MKNINLSPTKTMFKLIHYMFDEIEGKATQLDTSVQENVDSPNKEVDEAILKLHEDGVEDSIMIETEKIS